jgi:alpha-methylacyl-CoA racemase
MTRSGPLVGLRVIELGGLGPAPFAGMMMADLGAEVVRVDRPGPAPMGPAALQRGKRSIVLDLGLVESVKTLLRLVEAADILIEPYRPGVAERLGVGPEECLARNPRLIYGRMTGWGQDGPRAPEAGHDIDYIALTGALHAIGPSEGPPAPPLTLVGDFGGGAMFLLVGVLAALHEARSSGLGQVVDAAVVDGASALMGPIYGMFGEGGWTDARQMNVVDGGRPWYATYAAADGQWLAVGALEPKFWQNLVERIGLSEEEADRGDPVRWPALRRRLEEVFASRTSAEWMEIFDGTDACVAPVLSMADALADPHLTERGTFVQIDGHWQAAPAPRFGRTPTATPTGAPPLGADTKAVLADWGAGDPSS